MTSQSHLGLETNTCELRIRKRRAGSYDEGHEKINGSHARRHIDFTPPLNVLRVRLGGEQKAPQENGESHR